MSTLEVAVGTAPHAKHFLSRVVRKAQPRRFQTALQPRLRMAVSFPEDSMSHIYPDASHCAFDGADRTNMCFSDARWTR